MRALLPAASAGASDVDLAAAYAYPPGPWVRANMIASVDGAAVLDGGSRALGSAADRELIGTLRALADVVLVGAGTARVERYGPLRPRSARRSARVAAGLPPCPRLAVVSGSLDLDPAAPMFTAAEVPTLVVTCSAAPAERLRALGEVAEVVLAGDSRVDVAAAVAALRARGLPHVLCEGGARLLGQLTAAGRLDELCLTVSPLLVAGTAPRVLAGTPLPAPAPVRLAGVLEESGYLYLRYVRAPVP
ncbi:MAG: pyrimidine reductase family protein [Streptosporangiales bacterium]|nr:pyrimidine reductase family protein [Streptosporangiales bacterium]